MTYKRSCVKNELFVHVRDAFTDAHYPQMGLVQETEAGTLFLDEIGVISPYNQVKLLQLLQDSEYKRLGEALPHKADVRIVAATNQDLSILVRESSFREDLYYRLDVASLRIPPLRERIKDIPLLVQHFLEKYSAEYEKAVEGVSCNAMRALLRYSWPSNIRELENKLQNMILTASGPIIDVADVHLPPGGVPESPPTGGFAGAKRRIIDSFERDYLTQLLMRHRADVVGTAREARKSRTGLWNLIRKHGLLLRNFNDYDALERSERSNQGGFVRHRNVTPE